MRRTVRILRQEDVLKDFFRVEKAHLQYEKYDGSMSKGVDRLVLHRDDSVAVLLHDPVRRQVLLAEQFRYPTYGPGNGWLVELAAGGIEPGEEIEAAANRETLDETGYQVRTLLPITTVYLSPGGSSERAHIFYAEVSLADKVAEGGGLASESEDICLLAIPEDDAFADAASGKIEDAKTVIALQWLQLRQKAV